MTLSAQLRNLAPFMRTFGGFRTKDGEEFFGELRGEEVQRLTNAPWIGGTADGKNYSLGDLRIGLPVAPSKIIAVGLNYAEHIAEMKRTPLGTPLIWFKAPTSLLAHEGEIEIAYPEHQTHFELELAIVIGRRAKNVSQAEAHDFIFGYAIGEDISDRDVQKAETQFARAKSFDTYTPVGPFVHTEVEVSDLPLTLRLNGEIKQNARTSQMIYPVAEIVSFASQNLTLLPGDLILTGTPSGVGSIKAGDQLEGAIGDWPPLRNTVARKKENIAGKI